MTTTAKKLRFSLTADRTERGDKCVATGEKELCASSSSHWLWKMLERRRPTRRSSGGEVTRFNDCKGCEEESRGSEKRAMTGKRGKGGEWWIMDRAHMTTSRQESASRAALDCTHEATAGDGSGGGSSCWKRRQEWGGSAREQTRFTTCDKRTADVVILSILCTLLSLPRLRHSLSPNSVFVTLCLRHVTHRYVQMLLKGSGNTLELRPGVRSGTGRSNGRLRR